MHAGLNATGGVTTVVVWRFVILKSQKMKYPRQLCLHTGMLMIGMIASWQIVQPLQAATVYWDADGNATGNLVDGTNLGGTGTWDTGQTNWWNLTADVAWPNTDADEAVFTGGFTGGVPTLHTVTLASGLVANKLTFERSGYTLTGGSLTLAGTSPTLHASLGEEATISSQILGADGLTKTGGGTVRLTNETNAHTGLTSISNGILAITSGAALGADSSTITVTGSATRGFGGGALMLAGGYSSGVTLSRSVSLQGLGPVPAFGGALLSVGNNTITGLLSNGAAAVNTGITSAGGRLTLTDVTLGGATGTIFMTVGAGSSVAGIPGVGSYAITGVLSGSGSLQKSGGGTLIMAPTAAAGYSGTFRIYSGSMRFESVAAFGSNLGTGTLSTLDLAGDSAILELRMDNGAGIGKAVYMRGGGSPIMAVDHAIGSSAINGTMGFSTLNFDDGETLTFNGRNGYSVSFGAAPVNTGDGNTAFANNLNGLLTFTGDFWSNPNNSGNRLMTISGNGNTLIDGSILAPGGTFGHSLSKSGTGNLTITGTASTFTGNATVTGTLTIGHLGAINGESATGSIILGSSTTTGALRYTGAAGTLAKPFSLTGTTAGGAILSDGTGPLTLTGTVGAGGAGIKTLILGGTNTGDNTFSGLLIDNTSTNTTGLMKIGSGTWVLQESASPPLGAAGSVAIANPGSTGTTTLTLTSGTTAGLLVGQTITIGTTTTQITGILDNTHFTTAASFTTTTAPAGSYTVNAIPAASNATMGGVWSGPLTVANGILKLKATNAASNIVPNANGVVFALDTYTANQAAGGTLEFVGVSGLATTETLGTLTPTFGANTVQLTSGGAGAAANLIFSGLGTVGKGSSVNFITSGGGGGTVTINGVATSTATTLAGNGRFYINGTHFARSDNGVLVAPVYGVDAGFVTSATALTAASHNEITGSFTNAAVTISSLRISGSQTLTLGGNLTVNTGAAANDGGILQTGGSATITSDSATVRSLTTGGAGGLVIRVDGESDVLTLSSTVIIPAATTGGLTKNGEGTLVLEGANLQVGVTSINEGTVQLSGSGRLSGASQQLDLRQGATLDLNGVSTGTAINVFNGAGLVTNTSTTAATLSFGNTTGSGVFSGIIQDGAGVVNVSKGGTTSGGTLSGLNTYTGVTTIAGTTGLVSVPNLADIGEASSIGRGNATDATTNAASLVFAGTTGGINYTGLTSVSIDRLFTLNGSAANSGAQIANASANNSALIFNNTLPIAFGAGATVAQTLTLGGASTGDNQINLQIVDNGGLATRLNKIGAGVWVLGNTSNSYTGTTTITDGVLVAQDGTTLSNASGLILGGTTTSGVFQTSGDFTRDLVASASAAANTVSWNSTLTTGGGGFAASTGRLVVSLGGLGSPSALVWNTNGFLGTTGTTTGPLVLNSTTALGEVEFRNAIDLNGAARTITVNDNTTTFTDFATISGVISGSGGIIKNGTGLLQLVGANTYTGTTAVTAGQLVVTSLGNSATPGPSSLGDSTAGNTAAGALTLGNAGTTAGILHYVGAGETSDRMIRLNTTTGSTQILADGSGALILTNVVNDMAAGAKSLYLRGASTQGNMITSTLANNGGNLSLILDMGALWILSGDNTYSGNTTVAAGALGIGHDNALGTSTLIPRNGSIFAYGGDRTIANTVTVSSTTTGGTFAFIGDHNLRMTGVWNYNNTTTGHTITNGMTPGTTLTLDGNMVLNALTASVSLAFNGTGNTTFNGSVTTSTAFNVNISYTGDGTLTLAGVNPTAGTTTLNNVNGTMRLVGAGRLATGPLTVNAGSLFIESVDQSVTTLTMGNVANTTATINVAAGLTLSPTAITFAGTTTLPSTITGGGTLALGTAGITVTVADNVTQAADMLWTIGSLTGSGLFTKAGVGTLDLSGVGSNSFTGTFQINAGAIKGLEALSNNIALNGGVYQGAGAFTRGLGTGSNQVQWLAGGGGFAAVGGDLAVTLAGAPSPLVWAGTPSFLPNAAPLIFGSTAADGVTTFTHDIDLNGAVRTVSVVDNTAVTTDWAVLAGVLSNGGITKTGNGILRLGGANTFTDAITVSSGTLQFSTVSNNGGGPSNLGRGTDGITLGGGRLQFIGSTSQTTDRAMTFTSTGILDASGVGGASITFTGAMNAGGNSLNLEGSGDGFLNGLVTTTGTSADLNKNGTGTWTINVAPIIGDNLVITAGMLIFNAPNSFDGDDLFIRTATLKLGVNGALTNGMDDLNISTETAGGGVFDINGTTGSSTTDIIIGTNPGNPGTGLLLSGSMIDSVGGGSFSSTTLNVRNGLVSANVITTGTTTLGSVISNDLGGISTTDGTISGSLTLNAGSSLTLLSGTISGDIIFGADIATAKHSLNTVTLSGNNTVAGAGTTTIGGGTLILDHSANTGGKISDGALTMNGGTLQIEGHASTPVTVTTGALTLGTATDPGPVTVKINTAGADATLAVSTITRNAGATLRFNPSTTSGHLTTTATNTAGTILGGWATYQIGSGSTQFATVSGGEIVGLTSTVMQDITGWTAGADITDGAGFTGTLAASLSINSLRFDANGGVSSVTLDAGSILDIASGGVLITSNVASGNRAITGGRITAGTFNELVITHDGAAPFVLSSRMADSLALTKAGSGLLLLSNTGNTSTGTVRVSGGTLRLQGGGALGDRASVIMEAGVGALLEVLDSETIGALSGGDSSNYRNLGVSISTGKELTINQTASGVFYGNITSSGGPVVLTKTGAGTLTISDGLINLGAGGVINVNGGRFSVDVNGANQFVQSITAGTTVNVNPGASFFIEHNDVTAAVAVPGGRVGDDVVINMNGTGSVPEGLFFRNDENLAVTEVIGAVNFVSGVNSVRVDSSTTSANTTQNIILRASSITRTNQSTLVLRGIGIQASASPRAQFQNASVMGGFGTGTGTSLPVIPWAIGPAAGGTGLADSFLTTSGAANAAWRPLDLATEYAIVADAAGWSTVTSTQNVLVDHSVPAASSGSIRSLLVATAGNTVDLIGTGTLAVESGGFLFSGSGTSTLGGFSGITVSPFVNEYVFHVVGGSATVSSPLSTATAKLTKSGAGELILTASNLGLGEVTLNEGVVQISDLDNIGGGTGSLLFAGGTLRLDALAYSGDDLSTRTFTFLAGGGTVDTHGNNIVFASSIGAGSTGGFTKAGAGQLTLNAPVGYTGGTTISGGSLLFGVQDALPSTMNVTLAGGTLDFASFTTTLPGLTMTGNGTLTGSALLSITGDVQVDGGASRTLTVNNTALTTFSGGIIYLVNNGTSARITTINGTGNILISSEITNGTAAGALTYSGSGTLTLTGRNSYTGLTTLNNATGTLVFSGASQLNGLALTVNAGTAQLNPAFDQTVANLIMGGGAAGSSSSLLIGAGRTLTLSGTVTYSSSNSPLAATIDGGVGAILDFGGTARTFNIGDSTNAEPDMIIGANITLTNDGGGGIIKQGTGTLHIAGTNNLTGPIVIQAGAVTGNLGTGNLSLNNGVFEGNGTFTRALGAGGGQVQWVAGTNGGFAASGGPLLVTLAGAPNPLVWDGTPFFVSGAGSLLFGSTTADDVVTFTHNLDLNTTAAAVTRTITVNDNVDVTTDKAVLPGVLGSSGTGAVTLNKAGAGVLELTGANTFSALTVTAGILQFSTVTNNGGGASNLGQGTDGITLAGGTLSFIGDGVAGSQATDRAITLTASSTLNAGGTNGASITYSGPISAAAVQLQLTGTGAGFISGGITHTSTSPDLLVSSGTWTISGTPIVIGDDLKVNGIGTVLNFDTTGVSTFFTGASNFWYLGNGGTINLNANDVSSAALGLEGILVGFETAGAVATLNLNNFNITTPRLDVGQIGASLEGNVIGSGTLEVTVTSAGGGLSLYRGSVSANLSGAGALYKAGLGDVTLSGNNSGLSGTTRLDAGNLILDYTTSNTPKINAATALDMRGGTLTLDGNDGAATVQTVASFTLGSGGANKIVLNGGTGQEILLNLGAISRGSGSRDGTVRFVLPSGTQSSTNGITTTTLNGTHGLLGLSGFATVEDGTGTWFAINATNVAGGNIGALISTLKNDVATWQTGDHITDGTSGIVGTVGSANITSLRFDAAGGSALNITPGEVFQVASGGILVTSNVVSGAPGIFGGTLTSGVAEIIVHQDSAQLFEISSDIRVSHAVTKTGVGTLRLSGNNVYTGETEIQEGTLQVSGGNAIGDASLVNLADDHTSMLQLLADETIGRLAGGSGTDGLRTLATVDLGAHTLTLTQNGASTYGGYLTGTGTIVKNGALFDMTLNNASSGFTGTLRINGGGIILSGIGQIDASSIEINQGGYLRLTNSSTTRSGTRIADDAAIILNSADGGIAGSLLPRGLYINTDQDTTLDETVGVVTLGSGASYASLEATSASDDSDIIMANLVRTNGATLNVRGTNLGTTNSQGNQLRIGISANQTAFIANTLIGGGGAAGTQNISIVPWAIGETLTAALAVTNMGNSLVTYVSGAGFRPLDFTTEYDTFTDAAATDNVRESLTSDLTGLSGKTINALVLHNDSISGNSNISFSGAGAGQALTNTSGVFLFTLNPTAVDSAANGIQLGGFDDGIRVGAAAGEYVFHVVNPSGTATTATLEATISSALASNADITKSGRGTLILTGTNTAGGGATRKTTLNEGTLEISGLANIGGSTGGLVFAGGTLRLSTSYAGDDLSTRAITFLLGGGTLDTNGVDVLLGNSLGMGVGGFTKMGLGTLTLNAAASYTGATNILGGTVVLGASNALGSGDLTVNGATLDLGVSNQTAGLVTVTGAGVIQGSGVITSTTGYLLQEGVVSASLGGSVGVLKNNATVAVLAGSNTFTGPVEVQAGTLSFNSIANVGGGASALGAPTTVTSGTINMGLTTAATTLNYTGGGHSSDRLVALQGTTGGATIDADGSGALVLGGALGTTAGAKTLTLQGSSAADVGNGIGIIEDGQATLGVLKADENLWVLNGSNTYTGATSVNNGILRLNAVQNMAGALNFGSANNITTAGTLEVRQNATFTSLTAQTTSAAATNRLVIDPGRTLTINGNVAIGTGTGSLSTTLFDATGGGALVVVNDAASATFRVGGSASQGNVTLADLSGLDSLSVSLNTTNGVFRVNSTSGTNVSGTYSRLVLADNSTITASALAVGDGGQYNGTAAQINQLLLGTGATIFNVGSLNIGTGSRDLGSVTFLNASGTLTVRAADGVGAAAFNLGSGTSVTAAGLPAGNRNTFDVSGHMADLLFGAMSIGTQNTRTGAMETYFAFDTGTLAAGNLTMGSKTATGNSTNVMNLGGGTVTIGGGSGTAATLGSNTNTGVVSSTINVTGGTVTIGAGSGAALNLGANNTHAAGSATGILNVSGGSVTLATTGTTAATLASGSAGTVTGAINITGGAVTVQGDILRGTGAATRNASVTLNGGALDMGGRSIGASGNAVTFNAQAGSLSGLADLNGGSALEKTTAGSLSLGNGNTYAGGTTITAGTLLAMNTAGSATGGGSVTVLSAGTLGGTGSVAGNVQVSSGGILSPGTSAGQLTLGGTLNLDAGAIFLAELGGPTTNDADVISAYMGANGSLTGLTIQGTYENYQPGTTLHDNVNVTGASAPVINGTVQIGALLGGYVPQYGDVFDLLDWTAAGSVSGATSFDFSSVVLGPGLGFNTDLFASNGLLVVVPEPSRFLLAMLGLLGLLSRRRR